MVMKVFPTPEAGDYFAAFEQPEAVVRKLPIWQFPSPACFPLEAITAIAIPAIGVEADVLSFNVPPGFNGVIWQVANNFIGGGFTDGSGSIVWRVKVDGQPYRGLESIISSLGNPSTPSRLVAPIFVKESQLVELTVLNVNIVVAGQFIGGRLSGYFYPRDEEPEGTWY